MRTGFRVPAHRSFGPLLVVLALGGTTPGFAADYFPLVSGNRWDYSRPPGETATGEVFGAFVLLGTPTTLVHWTQPDQVYENFWSCDPQGRLYLHGARNLTFPFEAAYTPPILFLDQPMSLGQSWTTSNVVMTEFDGSGAGAPFDVTFGVGFLGPLAVPAGTYDAVGIGELLPTGAKVESGGAAFDLLGKRRPDSELAGGIIEPVYWFSDGTGIVQFRADGGDPFSLTRFSGPTPVTATTWSHLKALLVP